MASFSKRGKTWTVQIRKNGQSHTATFQTKAAAQAWATKTEAEIISGKYSEIPDKTVKDLLDRYIKEVLPGKGGERPERHRLNRTLTDDLARVRLRDLGAEHIAQWRDKRLQSVSAASVLREWATLANMFNLATNEWRWLNGNPMKGVKRPREAGPRQRTITQDEIDRITHFCGDDYSTVQGRVGLAFLFALETAMRAGEICNLEWEYVHATHVHLPKTKNGSSRDVPLSTGANGILDKLKCVTRGQEDDRCFGLTSSSLDTLFRKAKERALVSGFTFHDSRRTALTRLAKIFPNVLDLARISGHRDIRLLSSVYYAPSIEDLADKMR